LVNSSSHSFDVVLPRKYSGILLVGYHLYGVRTRNILSLYHFKKQVSYLLFKSVLVWLHTSSWWLFSA
jgi:hypothetical protein